MTVAVMVLGIKNDEDALLKIANYVNSVVADLAQGMTGINNHFDTELLPIDTWISIYVFIIVEHNYLSIDN